MPVSVVCESSANVSAALRESLGGSCSAAAAIGDDAKAGTSSSMTSSGGSNAEGSGVDCLQSKLAASVKRVLMSKIEYEEVKSYSQSVLEGFKSKYILLNPSNGPENGRASPATCNNNYGASSINGSAADANGNGHGGVSPSLKRSNPNELPQPKRVLYPRDDVRIGWKNATRKWQIGVGMMNVGNTCYLNSTLQAIFHVPAMANWLVSDGQHREQCDAADSGCIICAMAKTLMASQSSQSAIRPYFVYSKLKSICKHLVMGRQEDAHEFLRYLVEAMEKSYLCRFRNHKELDQYSKETTPLNQILGGYLRSAVRCLACNHVSVTFQHFQDLLLDIRKADAIDEALEGYFSRERLEDMGYKCESCKKKVSATKQFSLERAPIALCIQLKRFSMLGTKLNKQITIKPRLDLTKFSSRKHPGEQLTYKLVAMVTHLGASQHCGHYTAIGLTESGTYYNYDDSYVRPISMQNVCNTNAYIIFYEMDNTPPPPRQVSSTQVCAAEGTKENYHRGNGYGVNVNSQRIIGPQLPPTGLNNYTTSLNSNNNKVTAAENTNGTLYSNGSKLSVNRHNAIPTSSNSNGNSKLMIHFKNANNTVKSSASSSTTTATATSSSQNSSNNNLNKFQNGLLTGTGKFQESTYTQCPLAGASNKGKTAAVSNGNESASSSDNEDAVSSSTPAADRKSASFAVCSSSSTKTTLPSMPKLCDSNTHSHHNSNSTHESSRKPCTPVSATALKNGPKSLVPYESESDDDELTATTAGELKRVKCTTSTEQLNAKSSLKRHSSSSSDDDGDDDDGKPTNGVKVKKAAATTTHSNTTTNTLSHNGTNGNYSQSKAKQKTDAIDEIFNFNKRNASSNNNSNNNNNNTLPTTTTKKQRPQSQFMVSSTTTTTSDLDDEGEEGDEDAGNDINGDNETDRNSNYYGGTHPPFKRAHSTPPSPPVIKTKTGLWQVTTLQPVAASVSPPAEKAAAAAPKNMKNPFASKTPELFSKRAKLQTEKSRPSHIGNGGYQRDNASDNAVSELLKQSHRGYGAPVLTWNGDKTEIEKEIAVETREQRQRDWEEEQENDMDRGRQKKARSSKEQLHSNNNNNRTPGYNPFQEQDNQRRWKHGGATARFHGGHFRHQFQRNKFKFQRFNHKFQRSYQHQRSNGGGGYSRRDS